MEKFRIVEKEKNEIGSSLWRYISLPTLFLLLEGKAFFSSITNFKREDKFEGAFHYDDDLLRGKIPQETINWLQNQRTDGTQYATDTKLFCQEISKRRAAWCWHNSECESMAMWKIYGPQKGVAIKTTKYRLIESLSRINKNSGVSG
jgi:hypothetical protein